MICTPHPYLPTNTLLFPPLPSSLSLFPLFFFPTSLPHHSQYWKTTPRRRSAVSPASGEVAQLVLMVEVLRVLPVSVLFFFAALVSLQY